MTTELLARAHRPLGTVEVNNKANAKIVTEDPELLFRGRLTGGASPVISEPAAAWIRYMTEPGVFEFDYELRPSNIAITGVADDPWMAMGLTSLQGAPRDSPWKAAIAGLGTIGSHLLAVLAPGFEPVNLNTIVASHPDEDHLGELLSVNADPLASYGDALEHAEQTRESALEDIRRRLDQERATYAQRSPRDVATELGDELGVGQLVIARALGVTPTAVRKWRRGESARSEHRARLAQLAALCSLLADVGVHDPAGWIDIPISTESTLTPLDVFIGGRSDLVVLLGSGLADPREVLDEFDPDWRTAFAPDREYEVVTLADGSRSVVPREGG
jgi:DNA-binding transcriptional regulator YiaG